MLGKSKKGAASQLGVVGVAALLSQRQAALEVSPRRRTLVVFVTAFDRFALPAFDADAADYLTKPLTEARFDETLERIRERVRALWDVGDDRCQIAGEGSDLEV